MFLLMFLLTFSYLWSVGIALGGEAQDLHNQFSEISFKKQMALRLTTNFGIEYFPQSLA